MRIPFRRIALLVLLAAGVTVQAAETQSLSAKIDGASFVSDDDGITLVPLGNSSGSFSLSATTAGGSAYPPPKTPIDRLSVVCSGLDVGKPLRLDSKSFGSAECDVRFYKGVKPMGGDADAEYKLDKQHAGNSFEVQSVAGKVYAGRFSFRLLDAAGAAHAVEGEFKAEDRQL